MPTATNDQKIAGLYTAIFDRAPDLAGLNHWRNDFANNGADVYDIAAGFTAHEAFTTIYGEMSNEELVAALYQNILGSAGDTSGIQYWVDQLNGGKEISVVVADFVVSSLETDLDAMLEAGDLSQEDYDSALVRQAQLTNKANVGVIYADTLGEQSNLAEGTDANSLESLLADPAYVQSQDIIENVTADPASVEAAAAAIEEMAGEQEPPVDNTELGAALATLQAAQAAKAEFLEEAAEVEFVMAATGANTEAKVGQAVLNADAAVANVDVDGNGTGDLAVYNVNDSRAVKAAKVGDIQAKLADDLETQTEELNAAKADVAEVRGLASAIALYESRLDAEESAAQTALETSAAQASALASFNTLNRGSSLTVDATTGVVTGVIVADGDELVVAPGVAANLRPAATALLQSIEARLGAAAALTAATEAVRAAVVSIGYIDAADGDKNAIADEFASTVADADALTQADVQSELNVLLGLAQGALPTGTAITLNDNTGLIENDDAEFGGNVAAKEAYNDLRGAVNTFENAVADQAAGEYTFVTADLTRAQIAEQGGVNEVAAKIEALEAALAHLSAAQQLAAELTALNDAIEDAEGAFEGLDVQTPVVLSGTTIATAESDIFLIGADDATLINFNAQADDSIYVGNEFNLVVLGADQTINQNVGNVSEMEIFAKQVGGNTVLYVETEAFAGNSSGLNEITQITLNGVLAADLVLADGFLNIA